ncbi:MAG: hypothetical protein MUE70_14510 [Desulfobacterales bacterium]|jgi:hypothetical protein|nr:hypothetical protein [Desulfobacterales bacterium]
MMIKKALNGCLAILLIVSISGCASYMTRQSSLSSKLENGEKSVGDFVKYKYSGSLRGNVGILEKTPLCAEMVEKVRVAQKSPRGIFFIFPEIVFFGLGFYDEIRVRAIVEDSRKVVPLAKFESSELVSCGKKEPAANEEIVLHVRPEIINDVVPASYYRTAMTDENGMVDFNQVFKDENRTLNLTATLASDESAAVSFMYNPLHRR